MWFQRKPFLTNKRCSLVPNLAHPYNVLTLGSSFVRQHKIAFQSLLNKFYVINIAVLLDMCNQYMFNDISGGIFSTKKALRISFVRYCVWFLKWIGHERGGYNAESLMYIYLLSERNYDRLCGLVVRVSGYRSRGPGYDSRPCQIFWEVKGL
jgi:hypothetical protein